jgi:hypothetical protein
MLQCSRTVYTDLISLICKMKVTIDATVIVVTLPRLVAVGEVVAMATSLRQRPPERYHARLNRIP